MIDRIKNKWDLIQNYTKDNFDIPDIVFDTWILPLKPLKISKDAEGNLVLDILGNGDETAKNHVQTRYGLFLSAAIEEVVNIKCKVNIC